MKKNDISLIIPIITMTKLTSKLISPLILLTLISLVLSLDLCSSQTEHFDPFWDYLMFVQLWPSSWLIEDHNHNYNFTNNYFTIHGVWPEYFNGSWPQSCSKSKYFNFSRVEPIHSNLTTYWTNFINPSSFWQHEYLTHLTCINSSDLVGDYDYFEYGLKW